MFTGRTLRLRQFVAMLCMVATCVFCAQTILIQLDRVEHALGIEHDPNGLAGSLSVSDDRAQDSLTDDPSHPVAHAHLGDTGAQSLPAAANLPIAIDYSTVAFASNDPPALKGEDRSVLERPPNA